jgi:hypothetical protein
MNRKRIAVGKRIPAVLAAAAGIAAFGLFITPVASAQPGQCPEGQFPTSDGSGCAGVPDPTKYGCPPEDFQCMFEKTLGPR